MGGNESERELALSHDKLGDRQVGVGGPHRRVEIIQRQPRHHRPLIEQHPNWAQLKQELASFNMRLAAAHDNA
jgi:hypothetical protein